jgi:hypothetical protein
MFRIVAGRPGGLTPRLDDPLIWNQFNVATLNDATEKIQASTWLSLDLRGAAGEVAELFVVLADNPTCNQKAVRRMRQGIRPASPGGKEFKD